MLSIFPKGSHIHEIDAVFFAIMHARNQNHENEMIKNRSAQKSLKMYILLGDSMSLAWILVSIGSVLFLHFALLYCRMNVFVFHHIRKNSLYAVMTNFDSITVDYSSCW